MPEDKPVDPLEAASEAEYNEKIVNAFKPEPKVVEEPINGLTPAEIESNLKKQHDLNELPEEFNVRHIGDLTYLQEIFCAKYDKFKSLDYLNKMRETMVLEGHQESSQLNEFLFWAAMSRKMQIIYQRMHAKMTRQKGSTDDTAENIGLLKEMRAISEQLASLQRNMSIDLDKRKKVKDVVDLHEETMQAAESFIKSHLGECSFRCQKCGTIVDTKGLPHFAFMTEKDKNTGETIYYVFSPELWYLYRKKKIELHQMAFILRTSPEGILVTADMRGEYGTKILIENVAMLEKEEKELKGLMKGFNSGIES